MSVGLRCSGFVAVTVMMALSAAFGAAPAAGDPVETDPARWVDPMYGTEPGAADMGTGGGGANTFPAADVPFGMVQFGPDTVTLQHGGYYYGDNRIRGFSLTHLSGPGCDTYEDVPFMPVVGAVTDSPAGDPMRYVATFSHAHENVGAGRYSVRLNNGVRVDLSTTVHTGVGRFLFPRGAPASMLVNTAGSIMGADNASVTVGRDTISGSASSGRFCGTSDSYRVFFVAQFDRPFRSTGTWHNAALHPNTVTASGGSGTGHSARQVDRPGPGSGAYVTFDTADSSTVNVRIGLSFVSLAGARANLVAENTGAGVDQVAAAARAAWNERLRRIRVAGGSAAQRHIFYTALYHALLQPNVFSDCDGRYRGFDKVVHTTDPNDPVYTNISGWDMYRSQAQLLALIAPHEASDLARSMMLFAQQGGSWDRWTVAADYTGVMEGDPYHIIVSEMYAFGARDFDARRALRLMVRGATVPSRGYTERPGLTDYLRLGYVPREAAETLEYTNADFAIAQLAGRLGNRGVHDTFLRRAQNWRTLLEPVGGYLEPRHADGTFPSLFLPGSTTGYMEGNGAQYSWMVPYNYRELITDLGGNAAVNNRLGVFFRELNAGMYRPYAFLGNEPTLETPWIYDYTGEPYRAQALVNRVRRDLWRAGPAAEVGNDDLGEMSAWYVWAALGMYPEIPGRAELMLNSPEFTEAVISRPNGPAITIRAPGASTSRPYVHALQVNGRPWGKPWLPESFVHTGGTIGYTLSPTPDPNWGATPADAPPSFSGPPGPPAVSVPFSPAKVATGFR